MKLKQLESALSCIQPFQKPKIEYEQYPTSPHIASHMIYTAQEVFEDIQDNIILDLGVGCGMLSVASCLMDSGWNIGIDIDADALKQTQENMQRAQVEIDLFQGNIQQLLPRDAFDKQSFRKSFLKTNVDTIIMNPPFGTKTQPGIDLVFLQAATEWSDFSIYSLHKSSTRQVGRSLCFFLY